MPEGAKRIDSKTYMVGLLSMFLLFVNIMSDVKITTFLFFNEQRHHVNTSRRRTIFEHVFETD